MAMIDNVSYQIEEIAAKTGSYIEAFEEFANIHGILDIEEVLEIANKQICAKLKQEFIDKNYVRGMKKPNIDDFLA